VRRVKTKSWIMVLSAVFMVCVLLSALLFRSGQPASRAYIYSDGELVRTVVLSVDQEFTIPAPDGGSNTVTVRGGAIAVTEATCPDHYCMHRGFCDGGSSIVCLPNRLVIQFADPQTVDAVAG